MTVVDRFSVAAFALKGQELSVVTETLRLTELKILTVWPFNRKGLMAPAPDLRQGQRVYLVEGQDSMVVKNMGSRIRQTCVCFLAPPLTWCKTLCIIYLPESQFSNLKKGDDNKSHIPSRMVERIVSLWPRGRTQPMLAVAVMVVVTGN